MLMTLQEAIDHLKELLDDPNHEWSCAECKVQHRQLLGWLEELKYARESMAEISVTVSEILKTLEEIVDKKP